MRQYDYRALVECKNALEEILQTISLDWWTEQFAKDETPRGTSSGIVSVISNRELRGRAAAALERGRRAIADVEQASEK